MDEDNLVLKDLRTKARFLNYQLLEQIGMGGEGVVWSGLDLEHNRIVAIKFNELIQPEEQKGKDRMFDRQVGKLLSLRHPHILPIYDHGLTKNLHYLVSLYIPGGSMRDLLAVDELDTREALHFAAEIAAALEFLHNQNILHRDLKPSNILLDFSRNIYLSDFGLARMMSRTTQALHTGRGTPPYASPEQHAMKAMTRRSDIFSFGVLLFEIFTRHLPWDGEKALGIQQLYSEGELPDPCKINPQLPPDLTKVLRRMTHANPASRPKTVEEAVGELFFAFGIDPSRLPPGHPAGESRNLEFDAQGLLKHSVKQWEPPGDTATISLTNFALIELEHKQAKVTSMPAGLQRYLLHDALVFGYADDTWWNRIEDIPLKMEIAGSLFKRNDTAATARVVGHLLNDPWMTSSKEFISGGMIASLIETAGSATDLLLRRQILQGLRILAPEPRGWQTTSFRAEVDRILANMAVKDTLEGDEAAQLIGQIRSIAAVEIIHRKAPRDRRIPALLEIQKIAGGLPASIPADTRLAVAAEYMLGRFINRPRALLAVFLTAYFGSIISVGLQNYLIIRIPDYMDAVRISVSLERGLFLGAFLSAGILMIRLIVERFPHSKVAPRLTIATILGGAIFSTGLFSYDILMANIDLHGLLFMAGCLLAAFGFALGGFIHPRPLRILTTLGFVLSALALTWMIHTRVLNTGINLSPMFYYEATWSPWQILGTMLVFSLPISYFGNLLSLSPGRSRDKLTPNFSRSPAYGKESEPPV